MFEKRTISLHLILSQDTTTLISMLISGVTWVFPGVCIALENFTCSDCYHLVLLQHATYLPSCSDPWNRLDVEVEILELLYIFMMDSVPLNPKHNVSNI